MMTSVVSASVPLSSAASTTSIPDAWYDCTWTTGLKTATTSVDCDGMSPEEVFGWEGLGGDVSHPLHRNEHLEALSRRSALWNADRIAALQVCQAIKYVTVPVMTETACATSPSSCTTTIKKMGWPNGYWCKTTVAPTTVTESVDCQGCALKIERPWAAIKIVSCDGAPFPSDIAKR